jgi:hypothetical protein
MVLSPAPFDADSLRIHFGTASTNTAVMNQAILPAGGALTTKREL